MSARVLLVLLAPALISAVVIALARRWGDGSWFVDRPNERSLHAAPTPRLGGIGIALAVAAVAPLLWAAPLDVALALAAILAAISLADDARSLPMFVRLIAHFAAAAIIAATLLGEPARAPDAIVFALAVVAIAWMTNLFNFMDGADGLAGSMAAIGFGAFAIAAWRAGAAPLALAAAALASASTGFLVHNFPPARVFLGDGGSIPLGFLAGALGLQGIVQGAWPRWCPLLVFSPFIVDATATLAKRALQGKKFWRAHREHAYQFLALSGWGRGRLLFAAWILMAAASASALGALGAASEVQLGILLGWAAVYASLLIVIARHARSARQAQSPKGSVD